jgi:ribosomal protein S12 methylthiotransferase accessory factor
MAEPIVLWDQRLTARKTFFEAAHRTVAPAETLARLRPHLRTAGVTRLADITGLDRIGIPTVLAHRPNCPTLANAAGKGFSLVAATVSAAMEAVEIYHAENLRLNVVESSWQALPEDARIPLGQLPLNRHALFTPDKIYHWIEAWDLIGQRPVFVPYLCVGMAPPRGQRPLLDRPFSMGSNGLAGGNHLLEAIAAGLYETVERDAVACDRLLTTTLAGTWRRVDPADVDDPPVCALLERLDEAELETVLIECTVDTGIPCYMACLFEARFRHTGGTKGYGAHLDPHVAMVRAITEAVQARAIFIAGSRDDYFRRDQFAHQLADSDATVTDMLAMPCRRQASALVSAAADSFEADIAVMLDRLIAAGIGQVLVVDLSHHEIGIPVVRVIVPGLEGYMFDQYAPGPRAHAWLDRHL